MCKPTCVPSLLQPSEEGKEKCIKKSMAENPPMTPGSRNQEV